MATPSVVDIASHGDVVLVCGNAEEGTEVAKLRVESRVLILASPVFKAMLEPQFREGSQLATAGSIEIPLPDDNPAAMTTMCQVLHMKYNLMEQSPSVEEILEIGVVGDKYDCSLALSFASHYWITQVASSVKGDDGCRLLLAAYYLRQEKLFGQLSHDLVMNSHGDIDVCFKKLSCPENMRQAASALSHQRWELSKNLAKVLENIMYHECDYSQTTWFCQDDCQYILLRGADFVCRRAESTTLRPLAGMTSQPLEKICQAMKSFLSEWPPARLSKCSGRIGKKCIGYSRTDPQRVKDGLADAATRAEGNVLRLCIKCVQNGDIQKKGGCEKGHSV